MVEFNGNVEINGKMELNGEMPTPRLVIHEKDVRDLDKTAEVCAELLRPIFGTIYIEKITNDVSKQEGVKE